MTSRSRQLVAVALVVAVAAGVALALLLGGDDEDESPRPATTGAETAGTTTRPPATETAERTEETTEPRPADRRDERAVVEAVTTLVESAERADGESFCRAVGQPASAGAEGVDRCAAAVGIDPFSLPTSDELSISRVDVKGNRASAALPSGAPFSLRRVSGRWIVTGR